MARDSRFAIRRTPGLPSLAVKTSILLITVSGKDRPGIVRDIAAQVHQREGNWERGRLIHLADRFVGLLRVSVPEERREDLRVDLLSIPGLEITVAEGTDPARPSLSFFRLTAVGADHPGIVSEIFAALASHELNVESLSTRTEPAADSGTLLFRADAELSAEHAIRPVDIQTALEETAHDLQVEVSIGHPAD